MNVSLPSAPALARALLVLDDGREILVEFDPNQPRDPKTGRWRKLGGGLLNLPGVRRLTGGTKDKIFLDPYHTSEEKRASPRFKPLPKPKSQEQAREKEPAAETLLAPQIQGTLRGLETGESKRFPEGTLATMQEYGDGNHFRVDGPDGIFWRVPVEDAGKLVEFEEETARANRFGTSIPGNPMVPLPGVDVAPEDPIGDAVGGVLHGGYATLPRGTIVHRKPGEGGDQLELTSPSGVRRVFPASDKEACVIAAREFEKEAEGKLGGDAEVEEEFSPTLSVKDPNGPLQPLPPSFQQTRIALHAESERVLGFEHGGNEVALVQAEGGFATPIYTDEDGQQTRWRIDGTDTVIEKFPFGSPTAVEVARSPIGPPSDKKSARALANFFTLADRILRDLRSEGVDPGDTTDRRFDAPIIWPEHFDMAVELGEGDAEDPGTRAVYGASPGDETHPEPYFYVNPWALKEKSDTWNANGFNGAELTFSEVLASGDQEALIRKFFGDRLTLLGGNKFETPASAAAKADALAEFMLAFDPSQPRDKDGKWRKAPGVPLDELTDWYQGNGSTYANAILRGSTWPKLGPDIVEEAQRMIPAMDRAIEEGPEVGDRTLYRGIDLTDAEGMKEKLHKGETFSDAGFLSTSSNEVVADNFASGQTNEDPIVLKLRVPPETHNLIPPDNGYGEAEHVLPRGGTFTVESDPYDESYFGVPIKAIDVSWTANG